VNCGRDLEINAGIRGGHSGGFAVTFGASMPKSLHFVMTMPEKADKGKLSVHAVLVQFCLQKAKGASRGQG
jgi:hypothetical protein